MQNTYKCYIVFNVNWYDYHKPSIIWHITIVKKWLKENIIFGRTLDVLIDFAFHSHVIKHQNYYIFTYIGFDVFQKISGSRLVLGIANASMVLWCTGTDAMIAHHIKMNSHMIFLRFHQGLRCFINSLLSSSIIKLH